jgi:stress-induced morphogen
MRQWIEEQLKSRFQNVRVNDMTGTDDHFQAVVVSNEFQGKLTIARHRMIYEALGEAMKERIHALSLTTLTPEEAQAQRV